MEIYADAAVDVGYNPLYVRVKHDGKTLNDVHMVVVPDMDMGMMHHSCPVEQPESAVSDKDGFYHCAVIFTMPSTTAWKVGITIHDHEADTTITVHVPISVATSGNVKTIKDAWHGLRPGKRNCLLLSTALIVTVGQGRLSCRYSSDRVLYVMYNCLCVVRLRLCPKYAIGNADNHN